MPKRWIIPIAIFAATLAGCQLESPKQQCVRPRSDPSPPPTIPRENTPPKKSTKYTSGVQDLQAELADLKKKVAVMDSHEGLSREKYIRSLGKLGKYSLLSEDQLKGKNVYLLVAEKAGDWALTIDNTRLPATAKTLPELLTRIRLADTKAVLKFWLYPATARRENGEIPNYITKDIPAHYFELNLPSIATEAKIPFYPADVTENYPLVYQMQWRSPF